MIHRRTLLRGLPPLLAACALPAFAQKDLPPTLKIVVGLAPGGSADLAARTVARQLGEQLGRPILVENRTGRHIAVRAVAQADRDGATLLVSPSGAFSVNPHLEAVPYDPVKDFSAIAMLARVPFALAVTATGPYRSFADLLAAGKAAKNGLNYGVGLLGGHQHLVGQLIAARSGMHVNTIPYKGNSAAVVAAAAGEVDFVISDLTSLMPLVKAGRLRILASTDSKRSVLAPDLQTVTELGVANATADAWIGLFGPAGLPADYTARLSSEVGRALAQPATASALNGIGLEPWTMGEPEFRKFLAADSARWAQVIRERNIRLE